MYFAFLINVLCFITVDNFEKQLRQCEIVMIYKKTCPHSIKALDTLNEKHFQYKAIEEQENPSLVAYVKQKYHKTFPAIFINGTIFGGNDKFQEALEEGTFPIQPALKLSDYMATIEK